MQTDSDQLSALVARFRDVPGGLLPLLHAIQSEVGRLPCKVVIESRQLPSFAVESDNVWNSGWPRAGSDRELEFGSIDPHVLVSLDKRLD